MLASAVLSVFPGKPLLAAGLQISPISVTMPADKKADEVWLRNSGAEVVHAQVRVYLWSQSNGTDVLTPDNNMVASPPMVQINPGQQQLVRLVRVGALTAPAANERSYRLLVDELPIKKAHSKAGLDFVFRYSIPVFISGTAPARRELGWSVQQVSGHTWLEVRNTGTSHGQLANIEFTPPNGKPTMVANGLVGYVLPGQYRRIQLSAPPSLFTQGGSFTGMINGTKTSASAAPITKAP